VFCGLFSPLQSSSSSCSWPLVIHSLPWLPSHHMNNYVANFPQRVTQYVQNSHCNYTRKHQAHQIHFFSLSSSEECTPVWTVGLTTFTTRMTASVNLKPKIRPIRPHRSLNRNIGIVSQQLFGLCTYFFCHGVGSCGHLNDIERA